MRLLDRGRNDGEGYKVIYRANKYCDVQQCNKHDKYCLKMPSISCMILTWQAVLQTQCFLVIKDSHKEVVGTQ